MDKDRGLREVARGIRVVSILSKRGQPSNLVVTIVAEANAPSAIP